MRNFVLFTLLAFSLQSKAQTILFVDSSVAASGTGNAWSTAYKTLNEALNVANTASVTTAFTINVAKGDILSHGRDCKHKPRQCFRYTTQWIEAFWWFRKWGWCEKHYIKSYNPKWRYWFYK